MAPYVNGLVMEFKESWSHVVETMVMNSIPTKDIFVVFLPIWDVLKETIAMGLIN